MLSIKELQRPPVITAAEVGEKLAHLASVLKEAGKTGILLTAEGALRWLTGVRNQISDVAPGADAPVKALVVTSGKNFSVTFVTSPFETPRVKDEQPAAFKGVANVTVKFALALPKVDTSKVVLPEDKKHAELQGKIVRPLAGGLKGNQFKKLEWVAAMTAKVVADTALKLELGMNGADVRGLVFKNFAEHGLETNMILVALKGQGHHLHPLYGEQYKIEKNALLKIATAGRFGDVIVSETQMIKFGKLTKDEEVAFQALQKATVEYADLYRAGANEHDLYVECGKRFKAVEKEFALPGFAKSAYNHHLGGPTSPLGNRDYTLNAERNAPIFAGESFALNPVEVLKGTKVELQGLVTDGAPLILDLSKYVQPQALSFTEITASGGTVGKLPNFIIR